MQYAAAGATAQDRERRTTQILWNWASRDPLAAHAWWESLPAGTVKDNGLQAILNHLATQDPAKAVALYARAVSDAVLEGKASATQDMVQSVSADGDEFVEVREGA